MHKFGGMAESWEGVGSKANTTHLQQQANEKIQGAEKRDDALLGHVHGMNKRGKAVIFIRNVPFFLSACIERVQGRGNQWQVTFGNGEGDQITRARARSGP
jgi:hypothetical protein